jgi:hypothetical protein
MVSFRRYTYDAVYGGSDKDTGDPYIELVAPLIEDLYQGISVKQIFQFSCQRLI